MVLYVCHIDLDGFICKPNGFGGLLCGLDRGLNRGFDGRSWFQWCSVVLVVADGFYVVWIGLPWLLSKQVPFWRNNINTLSLRFDRL